MYRLVFAGLLALIAAPAWADDARELAYCSGVADHTFDSDRAAGDAEYLDEYADQAHIFMTLARRTAGRPSAAVLHEERRRGKEALSRPGLSDDDLHTIVQGCSDLHQQLMRNGLFRETP